MKYSVRNAGNEDLVFIESIYAYARHFMAEHGNPHQWGNRYPSRELLSEDINNGHLYVVCAENQICGVFYFRIGEDPTYQRIENGSWRSGSVYGTIHRIAGDGSGGILKTAVAFARGQIDHLRIDTHHDNQIMQKAVEKLGFHRRGIIYVEDGSPRIAYDLLK